MSKSTPIVDVNPEPTINKPQGKKIFNVIDLTKAITVGKKSVKKEAKAKGKYKETSKKLDEYLEPTIGDRQILNVQHNSVQEYINTCHPDIQTFIRINEIRTTVAKAGGLLVVCKNDLRVDIRNEGHGRKVVITDKKRNVLFNGITKMTIQEVSKAS